MTFSLLNAIIDEEAAARSGLTVPALADACLSGGARFLQIRAKRSPGGALLEVCRRVVERARSAGAIVIVNDRVDIARLSDADGVHLGQEDLDPAAARQILGDKAIIGWSTHSVEQARAAMHTPVDYIAVGPVFGTRTKETGYTAVGIRLVSDVRTMMHEAGAEKPIVAIGGITLDTAGDVIRAGAASVAVISDLLATGDAEGRVRAYLTALGAANA